MRVLNPSDPKKRGTNKRMNDTTYQQRREVMSYIYEARNLAHSVGVKLPRIEVRITEGGTGTQIGTAAMGGGIIWIPERTFRFYRPWLRQVVFHEILHAVKGTEHQPGCVLMDAHAPARVPTQRVLNHLFLKYLAA